MRAKASERVDPDKGYDDAPSWAISGADNLAGRSILRRPPAIYRNLVQVLRALLCYKYITRIIYIYTRFLFFFRPPSGCAPILCVCRRALFLEKERGT